MGWTSAIKLGIEFICYLHCIAMCVDVCLSIPAFVLLRVDTVRVRLSEVLRSIATWDPKGLRPSPMLALLYVRAVGPEFQGPAMAVTPCMTSRLPPAATAYRPSSIGTRDP